MSEDQKPQLPPCLHCALRDTFVAWVEQYNPRGTDKPGINACDALIDVARLMAGVVGQAPEGAPREEAREAAVYALQVVLNGDLGPESPSLSRH